MLGGRKNSSCGNQGVITQCGKYALICCDPLFSSWVSAGKSPVICPDDTAVFAHTQKKRCLETVGAPFCLRIKWSRIHCRKQKKQCHPVRTNLSPPGSWTKKKMVSHWWDNSTRSFLAWSGWFLIQFHLYLIWNKPRDERPPYLPSQTKLPLKDFLLPMMNYLYHFFLPLMKNFQFRWILILRSQSV